MILPVKKDQELASKASHANTYPLLVEEQALLLVCLLDLFFRLDIAVVLCFLSVGLILRKRKANGTKKHESV